MKIKQELIKNPVVIGVKIQLESQKDSVTYTLATANALLKTIGFVLRNKSSVAILHDQDQQIIVERALTYYMQGISDGVIPVPFTYKED